MGRSLLALGAVSLGALGFQHDNGRVTLLMKEESLTIEFKPADDEAVVVASAESEESMSRVDIRDPAGATVLRLGGASAQSGDLSGFEIESGETSLAELLAAYPVGEYELRGRTAGGHRVRGAAVLSHELLREPELLYPSEGARSVPTVGLLVTWVPDASAASYRLKLEQNENDGLVVELPGGSSSFAVPDHLLRGGTLTFVEIGAVAPSGNCTLAEVSFTTR